MTDYAGDLDVTTVWKRLGDISDSLLIDVRTKDEWSFVGVPDLSTLGKVVIFEEWKQSPDMSINPLFSDNIAHAVQEKGGTKATQIYFICRSGVRSQAAAAALTDTGYENCFNVTGGFEGPPDNAGHRGLITGWKAQKLPWSQD